MAFKHILKTNSEFIKLRNYCNATFWSLKGREALNKFPFDDIFSSKQKSLSFSEGSSLLCQWKPISSTRITKVSRGDWSSVVAVSVKVLLQIHKAPEMHVIYLEPLADTLSPLFPLQQWLRAPRHSSCTNSGWRGEWKEGRTDRQTSTPAQWHPLLQPEQHMSCTHGHGGWLWDSCSEERNGRTTSRHYGPCRLVTLQRNKDGERQEESKRNQLLQCWL